MIMYCYSTYKFSPVGFSVGYINVPVEEKNEYAFLTPCKDNFVSKCFETGIIKGIYGKYNKNEHYYFMIKGLKCDFVNEDNVPSHKKCNFLFEFRKDELDKYRRFFRNYKKEELEKAMNEFIIPDSSAAKFALKIHSHKLNEYINSVLSKNEKTEKNVECDDLVFFTMSSEPENNKILSDIVGCEISKVGESRYSTKKKSLADLILQLGTMIGSAILTFLDLLVKLRKVIAEFVKNIKSKM